MTNFPWKKIRKGGTVVGSAFFSYHHRSLYPKEEPPKESIDSCVSVKIIGKLFSAHTILPPADRPKLSMPFIDKQQI